MDLKIKNIGIENGSPNEIFAKRSVCKKCPLCGNNLRFLAETVAADD
jgi:hypothetical protein